MKATSIAFERRYSDDSGVQFGVTLKDSEITFESINATAFPVDELDWLIACLQRIKHEVTQEAP